MKLKHTLILTALTVAQNGTLVTNAAEEKPAMDVKTGNAQPAKKDKHPDGAKQTKQGSTEKVEGTCCRNPSPGGKKSPHDHQ